MSLHWNIWAVNPNFLNEGAQGSDSGLTQRHTIRNNQKLELKIAHLEVHARSPYSIPATTVMCQMPCHDDLPYESVNPVHRICRFRMPQALFLSITFMMSYFTSAALHITQYCDYARKLFHQPLVTLNPFRSYASTMIKQDRKTVSISKQTGFKYGNAQMMKSKGSWGCFLILKKWTQVQRIIGES